ncbi:MAG TPA: N-methyl-D-aspartate receptor NMDAR2C subunit [Gallionellaceae bacterium]|nr:N-methyl-D-aspartate receptor NMDAR2C subunit [Gallionellaceae bacterium]
MSDERWLNLMRAFGFGDNAEAYRALSRAYAEQHRAYHTAQHIQSCLSLLDEFTVLAEIPHEVELALWFHDAVYQPLSSDNERRSAEMAARFLRSNAASSELVDRVHRLVMVTRHTERAKTRDESLLLDIDLAILGAEADGYAEYEAGIRKEYQMIPWFVYRRKRVEILNGFMRRERIYLNKPFRLKFEQRARANLSSAVARLAE